LIYNDGGASKPANPRRRVNDPGIAFSDLPPIDVVLVSHGHYDHLDLVTLSQLAATHRARARSAMTPSCEITISQSQPKPTTGTIAWDM
jgi:L-ascorbate metabolism protein UlaG (beta-lactamase superfamily)